VCMLLSVATSTAFSAASFEPNIEGTATAASKHTIDITITASITENPFCLVGMGIKLKLDDTNC